MYVRIYVEPTTNHLPHTRTLSLTHIHTSPDILPSTQLPSAPTPPHLIAQNLLNYVPNIKQSFHQRKGGNNL